MQICQLHFIDLVFGKFSWAILSKHNGDLGKCMKDIFDPPVTVLGAHLWRKMNTIKRKTICCGIIFPLSEGQHAHTLWWTSQIISYQRIPTTVEREFGLCGHYTLKSRYSFFWRKTWFDMSCHEQCSKILRALLHMYFKYIYIYIYIFI